MYWALTATITVGITVPTLIKVCTITAIKVERAYLLLEPMEGACSAALPIQSAAHVTRRADFHLPSKTGSQLGRRKEGRKKVDYETCVRLVTRLTKRRNRSESHREFPFAEMTFPRVQPGAMSTRWPVFGRPVVLRQLLRRDIWNEDPPAMDFLASHAMILKHCQQFRDNKSMSM